MTLQRFIALPLLVAVLAVGTTSCLSNSMSREERKRQIEIHTDSCSLNLAMDEFQRAESQALKGLALDDDNFLLTLYLGRALLKQGSYEKIRKAEFALRRLPRDEDFRVPLSLAEVLERKGIAFREAAEGVESGERYTPAPDPVQRAKELHREATAALEESLELFDDALDMQPGDTEALNGLVRLTALLGKYDDSLAWGEALVRITRTDRLWFRKQVERSSITPEDEGRLWRIIERLAKLEKSVHLHAAAILNSKLDRPADAVRELDAVLEFDPNVAEVHSQRAQLLLKLGRYEEAIAALDSFMSLSNLEFEHPDIQRAFRIRNECESALVRAGG